ncbi:aminotransferase class V-fold PLP-dependent enzyme [Lentisphaera profundi]|uniref:Aminotransferase class V-fold PLP-dependent enzyme n=1 Tax=Lentisphaera profundi TaxID=1658616 RepID=A0ABY7VUE7_9BACT|nr:aminotransferase class V-fold PLP-dependent enzyme [Lentisphaera profundi]WDE97384.1 aminotransferase class V-fold PLP-dependent enzyme [Lentisphaera profundi]
MIYLDNAASTPLLPEIKNFYFEAIEKYYANPHAGHTLSRECLRVAETACLKILKAAQASPIDYRVIFTSGGTEANNLALLGVELKEGDEIITCEAEHPSILNVIKELKKKSVIIHYLALDKTGAPDLSNLSQIINKNTRLISLTLLHNETGGLLDIDRLSELTYGSSIHVHIDAVQGFGKRDIDMDDWGISSLSFAGHKFHGPNSSGALIVSNKHLPNPLLYGGGQQEGLRSGTLDAAAAAALGFAAEFNKKEKVRRYQKINELNLLCRKLLSNLKQKNSNDCAVNIISCASASPYVLLANFKNMQGAILMRALASKGIILGTGSACSADSKQISPALKSLGLNDQNGFGVLRISMAWQNTENDIINFIEELQKIIIDY